MSVHVLRRELWLPESRERVFPFFADARNLERITPPWLRFEVITPEPIVMQKGTLIDYRLRVRGLPMRWQTEIVNWNPPYSFSDNQRRGPYKLWLHEHRFQERDGGTLMIDEVHYELPLGPLGELAHTLMVAADVRHIFDYRNKVIAVEATK